MRRDVLIFLFVLGLLFFNWPIMSIFGDSMVLALFIVWFAFIACIFVASRFLDRQDGGG